MSERQQLYADSDITVGTYTPTPLWDEVDNSSDASFITSGTHITSKTCEVGLNTGEGDPGVDTASLPWRYVVRMKQDGSPGQQLTAVISLYQSTTLIATRTGIALTTSFVSYGDNLSDAEVASITDWTDLRVRVVTTGSVGLPRRSTVISSVYALFPIRMDRTRIRGTTIGGSVATTIYDATLN